MQNANQVEQFAGQRILAMDPRSEKISRSCPACHGSSSLNLGVKNELQIVSCRDCGSLYTPYSPWYSSAYYYVDYYEHGNLVEPPFVVQRLEEISEAFSPYRQKNRLLDVGCGAGTLLEVARRKGWNTQGVDVSASAVAHVRSLGFDVFQGELQEAHFEEAAFDVVTAAELLEHLFEPRAALKEIARILRPGGLLWTTTPHARGLSARMLGLKWGIVCPPEHLQLFSVNGLRRLLKETGFREVRVTTAGANPRELWHGLRRPRELANQPAVETFDRVAESYRLNEALTKNYARRILKSTVNGVLNFSSLGDSLKVLAVR